MGSCESSRQRLIMGANKKIALSEQSAILIEKGMVLKVPQQPLQ